MTEPTGEVAFVPKDGDLVCIVELHPKYAGPLCVGEQFLIGPGEGMAGAWAARDPGWCVIKRTRGIGLCRVELVVAAALQLGSWVEATICGVRHIGKVRSAGQYVYCDDVSGESIAAWKAERDKVRPWVPIEGDRVHAVYCAAPITGQFVTFFGGGAEVATADGNVYGVLLGTLSPAPGSVDAAHRETAEEGPTTNGPDSTSSTQPAEPEQPEVSPTPVPRPPEPLYVPKAGEWVRVVDVRAGQSPPPRFGRGDVVRVDLAGYSAQQDGVGNKNRSFGYTLSDWVTLWEHGLDAPCVFCRVVPADALDRIVARRIEAERWRTFAERLKTGLPEKRHPSDWEPPDDFEVCK